MVKKILLLIFACAGCASIGSGQGSIRYLSNITNEFGGEMFFGSDHWIGQSFETGTNAFGYTLDFFAMEGLGAPGSSSSIYADRSGIPGSNLGGIGISLLPSTTYWIVVTADVAAPTAPANYNFVDYAADATFYSQDNWMVDTETATFATSNDGLSWIAYGAQSSHGPFKFGISATAIPEPGIISLTFFLGLFVMATRWNSSPTSSR
ncbi:MAG TPA: hypothetical protein VHH88_01755 [Verrucomicrobiae bacterium]|nr:hypothetical protein [Verrucomicrobiae bacterium]